MRKQEDGTTASAGDTRKRVATRSVQKDVVTTELLREMSQQFSLLEVSNAAMIGFVAAL